MAASAVLVMTCGLQIAERLDPELGMKLRMVLDGGVGNYYSIESRQVLWEESIRQGKDHWLVGSGAGEIILGNSHSHNLVLDYFRGIGFFGALAVVLLCLTIMSRAALKAIYVVGRRVSDREKRIFACYAAAVVYVFCNQLSDCFGPSTIGALWLFYLPAVMAERPRVRHRIPSSVPSRHRPAQTLTLGLNP
jgi:O-antigen ligase